MILRLRHGYTTLENAEAYEHLLKEEVFVGIKKNIDGFKGIQLLKRNSTDEVEFITIMSFDNYTAIKQFAGEDYEEAYVPAAARKILSRFDAKSQHYEVIHEISH